VLQQQQQEAACSLVINNYNNNDNNNNNPSAVCLFVFTPSYTYLLSLNDNNNTHHA
jgi:hypothetical protein